MRKISVFILVMSLILAVGCGKSSESGMDRGANPGEKPQAGKASTKNDPPTQAGQKPGSKPQSGKEVDIDKLDIPDQVKEAIKSGRIPKEQIPEILARFQGQSGPGGEAVPVNVAPVQRKNLNSYLVLNGIVEPERKVEVFSRLSAYVKQIVKEEGAYVRENDVLALLDDTEIKISYEQSKIELEQAKLSLEEAESNYTRNQELIKRNLISEQDFQTQEAQYKQRQLDYENRTENFKNLQLQLSWTKIRALSEGYITERLIEVGSRVNSNQQVYTIEDFKPLLIRVFVPTSDSIKLETGMMAEVATEVLKGKVFDGSIKLINPRIDVQTGTVKVTIEVFDESLNLKPGMFVEARIIIGMKENVLVIPRKAILYKQNMTYVFVLDRNQAFQREVTLGLSEEDDMEVISGLEEGETIVVVGVEGLKDGQRVDVIQ
ncbi:MAG: efflux RND transporter periplasmic adaptor subunit [Candidatus Aminicenantes bacterium]|nr:efflux RND transporter periplasmic adaptor subunit [Candidatus Aminicenantes bacterium]MDH5705704.1 efflux RND transporter periplasmic adaptor subunit [Candidatus Aminicenantes bacterium]